MKKECDIAQDLLFSYKDGCLKQGSKEFVEKHLKNCEECSEIYEQLNKEEVTFKSEDIEVDYLKKIKKKMKKKTKITIIISIILVIIVSINILVFINYNNYANRMEIFLEDSISEEERNNIEEVIKSVDKDAKIEYVSKEEALNNLKEKFEDQNLLAGYGEENNVLPASYVVNSNRNYIVEIENKLKSNENIKKITSIVNENPYVLFFGKIMYTITGN